MEDTVTTINTSHINLNDELIEISADFQPDSPIQNTTSSITKMRSPISNFEDNVIDNAPPTIVDINPNTPKRETFAEITSPTFETIHKKLSNFTNDIDTIKEAEDTSDSLIIEPHETTHTTTTSTSLSTRDAPTNVEEIVEEKLAKLKKEFTVQMENIRQENVQLGKRIQEYQHRYKPSTPVRDNL